MMNGSTEINRKNTRSGFTLVEMVTSVAILGILIGVFYSVFLSNWKAMESYSQRASLWQDMDAILDQITDDARQSSRSVVSADQRQASFFNDQGQLTATYALLNTGRCTVTRNGTVTTLTDRVIFARSSFDNTKSPKSLVVRIALGNQALEYGVDIETSTEIYSRN